MIKTIIAYDNNDSVLGGYFNSSFLYINALKKQTNVSITELDSSGCCESKINQIIPSFNNKNFVFVALSHGSEDGKHLMGGDNYVNENNSFLFNNSFFYSTSCHIGKQLGNILFNNGCKCFIGYTNSVKAPISGGLVDLYVECELYALKKFYLTTKSIGDLFEEMILFIDNKFLELANGSDIVDAMVLLDNKNSMVLICNNANRLLTRLDFDV
jgi:hypothetical protein